ncbi:MAG: chorismate synthase [Helicobacteraceae bacterium]|jgi:chorismate synthase|nr:chorismate synthase [Helicobacteraceae bacterium]
MNTFGSKFRFTTFGESHGRGIGCVIDGVPAGLLIDEAFLRAELDRRKPGGKYATKRAEPDAAEILSGVFEGLSTGAPIAIWIANTNQKTGDYDNLRDVFRPAHADFSWFAKYGVRDHRGGGRSSARETAARVAAGAIAKLILREIGVTVESGVWAIGGAKCEKTDYEFAKNSEIFALDRECEAALIAEVEAAKTAGDSVSAIVKIKASGVPAGLGEPLYDRLDSRLAAALMGINAVKEVKIGETKTRGSKNNDAITRSGFATNNAGGVLGGVSSGAAITAEAMFKPTPSIFTPQKTINSRGEEQEIAIKGRHDPCVGIRGSIVCEAMTAIALADLALCNLGSKMSHLQAIYKERK